MLPALKYFIEHGKPDEARYIKTGGSHCLYCGSHDMSGSHVCVDTNIAWQEIHCCRCGATWQDVYDLVTVDKLEPPDEDAIDELKDEEYS